MKKHTQTHIHVFRGYEKGIECGVAFSIFFQLHRCILKIFIFSFALKLIRKAGRQAFYEEDGK